jgi:hypothetical protein
MKRFLLFCAFLAFWLVPGFSLNAEDLSYLGKFEGEEVGLVRIADRDYEVSVGTVLEGRGTVKEIMDTHLIIERVLSDTERAELEFQGAAVYDAVHIYIPHHDLRVVPSRK